MSSRSWAFWGTLISLLLLATPNPVGAQQQGQSPPASVQPAGNTVVLAARLNSEARAADSPSADDPSVAEAPAAEKHLGLWQRLESYGLTSALSLKSDWSIAIRGGQDTRGSTFRYLLEPSLTLDTAKTFGWKGGTLHASLLSHHGRHGSHYAGDMQTFSNIDADGFVRLGQFWYQHVLFSDKLRVKVGRVDANTEFAYVENGGEFLNSSMGFSPTIFVLPTYPEPRPSVNVFLAPNSHFYASLGFFDSVGRGGMPLAEFGGSWRAGEGERAGRVGVGLWGQTATVERLDGASQRGTGGMYVVFDQSLWHDSAAKSPRNLGMFIQYGRADGRVSSTEQHVGGGLQWAGPWMRRPEDVAGAGFTWVRLSLHPGSGFVHDNEFALEFLYRFKVRNWLSFVPDVQYIHRPGGQSTRSSALMGTIRLVVEF
jgi:carbohydrate-selective porin OprB